MFVGHYGISFAAKKGDGAIPLWVLFMAVQLLDVVWAPLVLLGVEKARIVPGFTATNPLDLYYMPYTHSLAAAICWSVAAVFSHWVLDFVVHRPDLPLFGNSAKVGLRLWNRPAVAFGLEAALLLGGVAIFLRHRSGRWVPLVGFSLIMLAIQAYIFFGPPPASDAAVALTALVAYVVFALVIWLPVDWRHEGRQATA